MNILQDVNTIIDENLKDPLFAKEESTIDPKTIFQAKAFTVSVLQELPKEIATMFLEKDLEKSNSEAIDESVTLKMLRGNESITNLKKIGMEAASLFTTDPKKQDEMSVRLGTALTMLGITNPKQLIKKSILNKEREQQAKDKGTNTRK